VTRAELHKLCDARIQDAQALFQSRRYSGAYYMAGYAVECALKACIARQTRRWEFPERNTNRLYVHDLKSLLTFAGLETEFGNARMASAPLDSAWAVVVNWSEQTRYETRTRTEASDLLSAVTTVVNWVRTKW